MGWKRRLDYTGGAVPTNASFVGNWVLVEDCNSIGFDVSLTGTGSPTGTWGADVTDERYANVFNGNDGGITKPITALTLTAAMTAQNPAGTTANINYLFMFDPCPRAKWMRFKYTAASGGSASNLLTIEAQQRGTT